MKYLIMIFGLFEFFGTLNMASGGGNISHIGHLGGLVSGLIIIMSMRKGSSSSSKVKKQGPVVDILRKKKLEQIRDIEAKYVATACSNCKRQLGQLTEYHKTGIEIGGVHDMLSRAIKINGKAAERQEY